MAVRPFLDQASDEKVVWLRPGKPTASPRNRWLLRSLVFGLLAAAAAGLVVAELPVMLDAYTIQN